MISKKAVKRAGELLKQNAQDSSAYEILSEWRSYHSYPLLAINNLLKRKCTQLNLKNAIIAQRLKRTPSIIKKLKRFEKMNLARMQDIGGLRIIVDDIQDVYKLYDSIVNNRKHKHEPLLPPDDYIKTPKSDGYRSLHQVFKFYSVAKQEYNGLNIELQIRTKLQHNWATAVEAFSMIEKTSLKTGEGKESFKKFFKLVSVLFEHEEQTCTSPILNQNEITKLITAILNIEKQHQIFRKLESFILSAKHLKKLIKTHQVGKHDYILLTNIQTKRVDVFTFFVDQREYANHVYNAFERLHANDSDIDLVLIHVEKINQIEKAYPNYFLDTQEFITSIKKICKKHSIIID